MKILVVEDQVIIQRMTAMQLKKAGYEVDTANNGKEALLACRGNRYDFILMDVMMPVMNGLRATKRIRQMETYQNTPIIAFTAMNDKNNIDLCKRMGMNDIVSKSIKRNELLNVINTWLSPK